MLQSFEYEALNAEGKVQTGQLEGNSERQVRDKLRKKNLTPLNVNAQTPTKKSKHATSNNFSLKKLFSRKLKISELTLFTQQLATLLGSGLPLTQSLEVMIEQSEEKNLKRWLIRIKNQILEGYGLGVSIANAGYTVQEDYVATVSAGEESGYLAQVLSRLADSVMLQERINKKVQSALTYPIIMVCFCIGIVGFLLVGVLPKVTTIFVDLDRALPAMTQNLISFSEWLINYWQASLITLLFSILLGKRLLKIEKYRYGWQLFWMKIPMLRKWMLEVASAKWSRTLSVLVGSGVPVVQALTISSSVVSLLPYKNAVNVLTEKVRQGHGISKSMQETKVFPILLRHLVASGEQSSALGKMLGKAAEQYENNIQNQINTFLNLLEPLLIIIMGGVIMLIVLSIMLPIFEMNQILA